VWCECRRMASEYFAEISRKYSGVSESACRLAAAYGRIADTLDKLRDKGMPAAEKADLIEQAQSAEAEAIGTVAALAVSLRSGDGACPPAS